MTDRAALEERAPTEAEPEIGEACLFVEGQPILLSEAVRWVEPEGDHVIRSLEFEVWGGGSTFEEALDRFIKNVMEFAVYLGELKDPAENEEQMFHRLAPRLLRVSQAFERSEAKRKKPLVSINLPLRRTTGDDAHSWQPSSRQRGSHQPSHA